MSRFVRPDVVILKLSDGDTLTVKARLNAGEEHDAFARMIESAPDGSLRRNLRWAGISLAVAYLVDWSLTDDDGRLVAIRDHAPDAVLAILKALDPDSYKEVREAIEAHDTAVRAKREQEKNGQGGGLGSPAISPSLVGVAGATATSVN